MKRVVFAAIGLIFVVVLAAAVPANDETPGPAAHGTFQVSLREGLTTQIIFDAKMACNGTTTGEITFQDTVTGAVPKSSTDEEIKETPSLLFAKVQCDCLLVKGVEAALSGTIVESNNKNLVGGRVMLVVQDGDSLDPPLRDKLTFGFYKAKTKSWLPSDAERPEQQGSPSAWVASDSEREDDAGVLSIKREEISCDTYPMSSYSFINSKQGKGKVEVSR